MRNATDGARAMSGTGIGFEGILKYALKETNIRDDIAIFHCINKQQNLSSIYLKMAFNGSFYLREQIFSKIGFMKSTF